MIREFSTDLRGHEVWKFGVALDLAAAGSGAATVLFCLLYGLRSGVVVGLAMGCLGGIALFADLGHRVRFWRAFARGTRTWISLGTLANAGLLLSGALFLLVPEGSLTSVVMKTIALICSLTVMVYGAGLLSSMGSIPFWRDSILPIVFLSHSAASGIGVVVAVLALMRHNAELYIVAPVAVALLLFAALFTWLYSRRRASSSEAVRESVRLLTKGRLKGLFVGGVYLSGLLVPVLLIVVCFIGLGGLAGGATTAVLSVAAIVLRFVGDISFRYAVLQAGMFEPVI